MIELVTVSIAGLGLVLVGLLYVRLREVNRTLQLKRHRSGEAGVCDLLNYAAVVANGIVIGKNGTLIAGWEYTGDDNASTTDTQRDVVSVRVNQALARLGSDWMLHVDAVRRPVEVYNARRLSHFPDRISEAIDEERRVFLASGGCFTDRNCLCKEKRKAG
jgi:type IV secretion system protein TrbE